MSKGKDNARRALEAGYFVDGAGVAYGPRGKPLTTHDSSTGFPRFNIRGDDRKTLSVAVHQLAALVFFGERGLDDGVCVIHLDRNRHNNAPSNLTLGTRTEAQLLIPQHERILYAANAARKLRLLTDGQVLELRAARAAGATLTELAERFGIAKSTASYIVNRRTYA